MTALDDERLLVRAAIAMVNNEPSEQVVLSGLAFSAELVLEEALYAAQLGVQLERDPPVFAVRSPAA